MATREFEGGVFAPSLPGGRTGAVIELGVTGVEARTAAGERFKVGYADAVIEVGGTQGSVVFCHTADRSISIFTSDREFLRAMALDGVDPEASAAAQRLLQDAARRRWTHRGVTWVVAGVLVALLVSAPFLFRWLVGATVRSLPISIDARIGADALQNLTAQQTRVADAVVTDAMARILARLRENVPDGAAAWDFRVLVVEDDASNAFAVPGGGMVFFTGLLRQAESADEVAGVMAHEMGHVLERHALQRVAQSLGVVAGAALLFGDTGVLASLAASYLTTATIHSYSREAEAEADRIAVAMLHRAGLDPTAVEALFARLRDRGEDGPEVPHWIRSHPTFDARIAAVRAQVGPLPAVARRPLAIDWRAVRARLRK